MLASAAFNDNARSFGGGLAFGSAGPFGQAAISTTSYDGVDEGSFTIGGGAGYQFKADAKGLVHLCPIASVSFTSGPSDVDVFGDGSLVLDVSETDLAFGLAMGIVASNTGQTQVIPNASLSFVSARLKVRDQVSDVSDSDSEAFGVLGLGVGFVVSRVVTLHPGVSIPIGLDGSSASFAAFVSISFGRPAS